MLNMENTEQLDTGIENGSNAFRSVVQTLDYVSGLHNYLEFSQPSSCLDEAM